jgi:hypothetical protein
MRSFDRAIEDKSLSCAIVSLLVIWFKSSVCIVFHGSFIGNPVFPLPTRNNLPYMNSAMGCALAEDQFA